MEKVKNSIFKNTNYTFMLKSNIISTTADILFAVSIGIWVYKLTNSTALMGIFSSFSSLVSIFFVPIISDIIDKYSKSKIIVITDLLRGLILILSAIALNYYTSNIIILLIVSIVVSLCNSLFNPAITAAFTIVIKKEYFMKMTSINNSIESVISLAGTGIFTLLALKNNISLIMLINGMLFLLASLFAWKINFIFPTKEIKTNRMKNLKNNISYILQNVGLSKAYLFLILFNIFTAGLSSLFLPFFISKSFNENLLSVFLTLGSIGAIAGMSSTPVIKKNSKFLDPRTFIIGNIFCLLMIVSNNIWLSSLFYFISSYFNGIGSVILSTAIVKNIDEKIRGQIISIQISIILISRAISATAYGIIGEFIPFFIIPFLGNLICILVILFFSRSNTFLDFVKNQN